MMGKSKTEAYITPMTLCTLLLEHFTRQSSTYACSHPQVSLGSSISSEDHGSIQPTCAASDFLYPPHLSLVLRPVLAGPPELQ